MKNKKRQLGISLIIVIFLLAAVSVMALSMVRLSATQHLASFYAARGAQAYFAARAGMEYATATVVAPGGNCGNLALPPITIEGFDININCAPVGTFQEGVAGDYTIFRLTVIASNGNFAVPDVANRRISATVRRLGP